jgi:drug/metabolite transporter (DMT)-like permease
VRSRLDLRIRDAIAVAVPAVPLAAIHRRERAIARRSLWRRNALLVGVTLLVCAGLAVATAGRPVVAVHRTPVPVASLHPIPIVT